MQARKKIRQAVEQEAYRFGFQKDGTIIAEEFRDGLVVNGVVFGDTQEKQYQHLKNRILLDGYNAVIEEAAYTWFNRFIALRYMEVNEYLPINMRILSSKDRDKGEPEALTNITHLIEELNLNRDLVYSLQDQNKNDELYRYLLIHQCNALGTALPTVFGHISEDIGLLLPSKLLTENSVLDDLITMIDEEEWKNVEIVGWLYQFYVSEEKDAFFENKSKKAGKEDIGPATQLFTPRWIVQYMVDNSLGRYWLESHPDENFQQSLDYYLEDAEQSEEVEAQLEILKEPAVDVENIKFLDPSCGSGHILVYAFEVFHKIYVSRGYRERKIPQKILQNNLFGLDIDKRAAQLATFAVVMKAREYDRRLFNRDLHTNIFSIEESNHIEEQHIVTFSNGNEKLEKELTSLVTVFEDAKLYGSIIQVPKIDIELIEEQMEFIRNEAEINVFYSELIEYIFPIIEDLINQYKILSDQFEIVVTNPPYLNRFDFKLKKYVNTYFGDYKKDLFSVFIYVCSQLTSSNGYNGFMTPFVWMFISSYEKLRQYLINQKSITNLIQMEYSAFKDATVPLCTFVIKNDNNSLVGHYVRLSDFKGGMTVQEEKYLDVINNNTLDYLYEFNQTDFSKIPGSPIAYWANNNAINAFFKHKNFDEEYITRAGMITGNNDLFVRFWFEVEVFKFGIAYGTREDAKKSSRKWFPYSKGGGYRRWFGNNTHIVEWKNDGYFMKNFKNENGKIPAHAFNLEYIFKPQVTWSSLTSNVFSARYASKGFLFDAAGSFADIPDSEKFFQVAFLNSKVCMYFLSLLNPTLNFQKGNIGSLPIHISNEKNVSIKSNHNIEISKKDWDSFETSWDFEEHPFLTYKEDSLIETSFKKWAQLAKARFNQLKENEEELNRIFIDIYGLQDELTPEVEDKDVTVRRAKKERDVKSFLSYLVGVIFGRYSLDTNGLAYAGGEWDEEQYITYKPDETNIIPVTEEMYYEVDLVKKVEELISLIYGEDSLEENLQFIAETLKNKPQESTRDCIRRYFQKDFFKDHKQIYKKRPIYWMFSSGKRGAFQGLMYLHRYDKHAIGRLRLDYVLKESRVLDNLIALEEHIIEDPSTSKKEKATAQKKIENFQKDKKEIVEYAEILDHVAKQQIELDLDDGVKVNYEKFQGIEVAHSDSRKLVKKDILEKL